MQTKTIHNLVARVFPRLRLFAVFLVFVLIGSKMHLPPASILRHLVEKRSYGIVIR